jgi:predicted enzyme related to lactoylglutathione lyase
MPDSQGKFVWYELVTDDVPAAEKFYTRVLGWSAKDSGMPGMAYTIFSAGEAGVGGVMAMPGPAAAAGMKPAWMGYVAVDDVDASVAQVVALGGALHKPAEDIPGVGRFAVIADPQGASLMVFKPSGHEGPRPVIPRGTPGHAGWHELYSRDAAAGFEFYQKIFGWTKAEAIDMGPMGTYQIFAHAGVPIGGMMNTPPECPKPIWGFYFNVDNITAAIARVEAAGGKVFNGPMEVPGGEWIAQCRDPQGAMVSLVAPPGAGK